MKTGLINRLSLHGFTGHYYHAPSGLDLTLYRAYSADLGRWLSRDPLAEPGFQLLHRVKPNVIGDGPNLYEFVHNNPPNLIDDQGLSSGFLNCIKNALCEMGIEYTHATLDLYLGCIAGCAVVSGGVGVVPCFVGCTVAIFGGLAVGTMLSCLALQ